MYKQMNVTDLIKSIKTKIETNTNLPVFDIPPKNQQSPFVYMELVGLKPADTKTMFCKLYTVWLHIIAEETKSSIPIYNYIEEVQEALTEDIEIPCEFNLVYQSDNGIQMITTDETGEKHAILEYEYKVNYGYKIKE